MLPRALRSRGDALPCNKFYVDVELEQHARVFLVKPRHSGFAWNRKSTELVG